VVGFPTRPPNWGFGFHLCRWGYTSLFETKKQVDAMRAANIPLEGSFFFGKKPLENKINTSGLLALANCSVMWNDLELYHDYRDFTVDPVEFAANEMRDFIRNLVSQLVSP
jgi:alpha-glucosidase